ncbi:MAG: hypothetical protein QOH06_5611 [Acidobacteriota bacterium]|jgi:DNA-binding winged helix-turn-helix (wHTH) protein/tetratricopeptide (TPR) repeat protein|nr:hypothetical protein [Acidobacteriota bacterium]
MMIKGPVGGRSEAVYEFGPFRFEPEESRLLRDGRPVPLAPQSVETLRALVEHSGSLITKQELMDRVWPDRFVEENSLNKCVSELRKALGDRRLDPLFIETVARRGYRFLPGVRRPAPGPMPPIVANGPQVRPITVRVTVEMTLDEGQPRPGEDEIARRIAIALAGGGARGERRDLRRRATRDTHAYRLYREARCHVLRYTSTAWRKSLECYEGAIAQDPSFALAHADLAISSALACLYYTSSEEVRQRARSAALQAVAIDPGLGEAHLAMALVRCLLDWDWDGAERSFHQALALDPEQAWSHDYYGLFLMLMGRFREALPILERAVHLNPIRIAAKGDLGLYHLFTGAVEGSLSHHRRALELDPFCGLKRVDYARTLERAGRPDEAIAEGRATLQIDDVPWARVWLARAHALAGRPEEARRILVPLGTAGVSPVFPALIHAALGEPAEALVLLDDARARRSPWMAFLRVEPGFDALREERGFARLQRRVGLAP